jgi:hypothetical protein
MMPNPTGHSSKVTLDLLVNGAKIGLSQVCPDELFLESACEPIPPMEGQILIGIDGVTKIMDVFLPHGITGRRISYY